MTVFHTSSNLFLYRIDFLFIVTFIVSSIKNFVLFGNNFKLNKDFKLKTSNKKAQYKEEIPLPH